MLDRHGFEAKGVRDCSRHSSLMHNWCPTCLACIEYLRSVEPKKARLTKTLLDRTGTTCATSWHPGEVLPVRSHFIRELSVLRAQSTRYVMLKGL
eukprot:4854943-Amphidinium_carterae.1